jgi:hypothetical protein
MQSVAAKAAPLIWALASKSIIELYYEERKVWLCLL